MRDTLTECIINKKSSYTPIWFMRQAGRYLPEFREIRKKNPDFISLCLKPDLVNDITLQPLKRFDIDAAIIFSDILMIPYGLGQQVEFKKGIEKFIKKVEMNKLSCDHEELVLEMIKKLATYDTLETHLYSFQFILFDQKCISNTCISTRSILAINQAEAITELKQVFADKCVLDIHLVKDAA